MRFFSDGPALPRDLVDARDEGRVVFFCGAGVSRARAGLLDFTGLATSVVDRLRPRTDGAALQVLNALLNLDPVPGVGGLISTDRVFGLLEREFEVSDVRSAVARSLKPKAKPDLSCHKTLIDLARGPDRIVRLVTTNFDRLFEKADPTLRPFAPPSFPDPRRGKTFNGVVHLHGCVTPRYDGAQDDEFVLSPSDFGRAYLSEAWATAFIQRLMKEYELVFVGYAADDPPIQYLLEALSRSPADRPRLYALHGGTPDEATALWAHRGVEPIAYDPSDNHSALWRTLEGWAERARDIHGWTDRLLTEAQKGPRAMSPVGRGQVAQLVSSPAGARKFAKANPPAEWVCVMDCLVRYGQPTRPTEDRPIFDPFDVYRLDDDPFPPSADLDNPTRDRGVPSGVWDAFSIKPTDREGLADQHLEPLRGPSALAQANLLPRIWLLASWIAELADQPIIVWWAAGSGGLHASCRNAIRVKLERIGTAALSPPERAWPYILASWEDADVNPDYAWIALREEINRQGWTKERIRRWSQLSRPRLRVRRPWFYSSPLAGEDNTALRNILDAELDYPNLEAGPAVGDGLKAFLAAQQRGVLEAAIDLERELSGYEWMDLPPVERDNVVQGGDDYNRTHGLSGLMFDFVGTLEGLANAHPEEFRREVQAWTSTGTIFSRLRIWAAGRDQLDGGQAAQMLLSVPREQFWSGMHQRDLLLVLARRWSALPKRLRKRLEARLLQGPATWPSEKRAEFRVRRASVILNRLGWFKAQRLPLSFDVQSQMDRWRTDAPEWREQWGEQAAASQEGRSGSVARDTSTRGLEIEPPATMLSKAIELTDRDHFGFVDHRPLEGLAETKPLRYVKALALAHKRGEFPRFAWETFLFSDARAKDPKRLRADIAVRLTRLPQDQLAKLATPASQWMLRVAEALQTDARSKFDELWIALLSSLRAFPEAAQSSIVSGHIDWATHALNSPTGRLAQALMKDPAKQPEEGNTLAPSWAEKAHDLLSLPGNAGRDALVIFSHQLPWLFYWAKDWTELHVLSKAFTSDDKEDARAFWAGFFWAAQVPSVILYKRIKPELLRLVHNLEDRNLSSQQLSGILLAGWGTRTKGVRCVTDAEMRAALLEGGESFRGQVAWHVGRWCHDAPDRWSHSTITLLREVWPRQASVRTPSMSDHLISVALQNEVAFPETVHVVLPLICPVGQRSLSLFRLKQKADYDGKALVELVFAALPVDASGWPYAADDVVEKLGERAELADDPKLVELRRRLAAR